MRKIIVATVVTVVIFLFLVSFFSCATTPNKPSEPGTPMISNFRILDKKIYECREFQASFDFFDEDGDLATVEVTFECGHTESHSFTLKNVKGKIQGSYGLTLIFGRGNSGRTFTLSICVIDRKGNRSNILAQTFFVY